MADLRVDVSLATAVYKLAQHSPDRPVIIYEGRRINYRELAAAASTLATVLATRGIRQNDRVAYIGRNSLAFFTTFLAATWIGAIFVPVNYRLAADEVCQVLKDSDPSVLVVEAGHRALVDRATDRSPVGQRLLVDDDPAVPVEDEPGPGWVNLSSAVSAAVIHREPQPRNDQDIALLAYTSGTTGQPKGVTISHGNLWWNGVNLDYVAEVRGDDVNLVVGPLFHTATLGCFTLRNLVRGGTNVVRRSFDAAQTLTDLVEMQINTFFAVPTMYAALTRLPAFAQADLSALRTAVVAGAPTSAALIADYANRGVSLQQAYGSTEALFSSCLHAAQIRNKIGSVGVALPFTDICLAEDDSYLVLTESGARGEVCLRGPTVTRGYWNNPTATAAAFDAGGWFHTGDIGYFDPDGWLYILDRAKDVIIIGGDNVYPAEVERILADFPGVLDLAVIGVPDETWGERVIAVVSCAGGAPPSLAQIRRFAEPHLASYKLPTRLYMIETLPRNAMGKIDRHAIRLSATTGNLSPAPIADTLPLALDPAPQEVRIPFNGPNSTAPDVVDAVSTADYGGHELATYPARSLGAAQYRLVLQAVKAHIAELLEQAVPTQLDTECTLEDLGIGSLYVAELRNRLSADTGLHLPMSLLSDCPTVDALVRYLCAELTIGSSIRESAPTPMALLNQLDQALVSTSPDKETIKRIVTRLQQVISGLTTMHSMEDTGAGQVRAHANVARPEYGDWTVR